MPTYEYRCPKGHHFELFQRMSDEPGADCPECGEAAERLLSAGAGFLFKGEGFYITDYRSDSYQKAASADGKAGPSTGEKKADSGGEGKPEKSSPSDSGGAASASKSDD